MFGLRAIDWPKQNRLVEGFCSQCSLNHWNKIQISKISKKNDLKIRVSVAHIFQTLFLLSHGSIPATWCVKSEFQKIISFGDTVRPWWCFFWYIFMSSVRSNRTHKNHSNAIKTSKYWKSSDPAKPCLIRFDSVRFGSIRFGSVGEKSSRVSLYKSMEAEFLLFIFYMVKFSKFSFWTKIQCTMFYMSFDC